MTLNEYMDKYSIGDAEVAEKIGVSRQAVTQYRLGYRMPKPEIMVRLMEVTNNEISPLALAQGLKRGQ
jgi:transcriptional regulator with XRE-family HTH domain